MDLEYTYISSRQNPTVQRFAALSSRKKREEERLFCADGVKLCREALGNCSVAYAAVMESRVGDGEIMRLCRECGGEIIVLSDSAFAKLSADSTPDGLMFVCRMPDGDGSIGENESVIMLEAVRDPGNVGTIIRSAAAFGYDRVILADCADIYNPKTLRASMGAAFKLKFTVCSDTASAAEMLHSQNRLMIGAALGDESMVCGGDPVGARDCIVIGNEGHGLSEAALGACDRIIKIPMSSRTESLNAAAAAAVLMWEYGKCGRTSLG